MSNPDLDRLNECGLEHHAEFVNGVKIHYVRAGKGPPVVLLHGWPQTWYMWRRVIPRLAEQYTVIAPDLRGFGDSGRPRDGFDKRNQAIDMYQLVQRLELGPVFLVGHDLGGPTAYAYACANRDEVRGLAIIDVAITIDEDEMNRAFRQLFHLSFHARPDIAVALVSGRERTYLEAFYRDCYNPGAFTKADLDEYVSVFSQPGAMRASMASYATLPTDLRHNQENAKTKLEMPVLALGGAMSFGMGTLKSCQQIATDVRGGVIDRCAHWVAEEQPEALSHALLEFFSEC